VPRPPRDIAAGTFHVYSHCVYASAELFRDTGDRVTFLTQLARVTRRTAWTCVAFCLMGNHFHLIVRVEDGVLPKAMHALNLSYARGFNRRHGLKGHVMFARYGAKRIRTDASLAMRFRYVVRNPVRAGLCASPQDWPWSSYAGTAGLRQQFSFVDDRSIKALYSSLAELREAVEDMS
jgi:REP element-mobilizing transposase RayT